MLIAATISEMMSTAFKREWPKSGRLKLRFREPVLPGGTVATFGHVKRIREGDATTDVVCTVGVRKQNGESAVTGEAVVTIPTE
jgi:acyl dehydratase